MPPWLLQQLETKTGGFRAARWRQCDTCRMLTLRGMDSDLCARIVTVDPTPLTPDQAQWASRANREVFQATLTGRKVTINDLSPGTALTGVRGYLVPTHRCGGRTPGFLPLPPKPGAVPDTDDVAPF